ncbi:MAG: hypothetical protein IBJ11_09560 [Phycisphaerales bacterium]|nr:hypothetical protein [Phycisphaerales bacterium]
MRRLTRPPPLARLLLAALFAAAPGPHAPAQTLNLDPPSAPAVGDEGAVAAAARRMADEARDLAPQPEHTGAEHLARRAAAAWRTLAARLLRADGRGDARVSPIAVLRGLQMAHSAHALDEALGLAAAPGADAPFAWADRPAARAASDRFAAAVEAAAGPLAAPETIATADELDRLLRDTLGDLADLPPHGQGLTADMVSAAWPAGRGSAQPAPDDAALIARLDAAAAAAGFAANPLFKDRRDLLAAALARPLLRPAAQAQAAAIAGALDLLRLAPDARWMAAENRERLAEFFADALARLADRARRSEADLTLRALAGLAAAAQAEADLRPLRAGPPADTRPAQQALDRTLLRLREGDDPATALSAADLIARTLRVSIAARSLAEPKARVRGLASSFRQVRRALEAAEKRALAALPRLASEAGRTPSPDAVTLLLRHRQTGELLADLDKADEALAALRAGKEPEGLAAAKAAEALILDLADEAQRDAAAERLARLHAMLRLWPADPGPFASAAADARRAWLGAWSSGLDDTAGSAAALARLKQWGAMARAAEQAADARANAALEAWSAAEIRRPERTALRDALQNILAAAPTDARAAEPLARAAPLRLLARLLDRLPPPQTPFDRAGLPAAVARLAAPPAGSAMLLPHRADLADFSRWLAELAAARDRADQRLANEILTHLAGIAERLLDAPELTEP